MHDLLWWENIAIHKNGLPLRRTLTPREDITIYCCDASDSGWGGIASSHHIKTSGFWNNIEKGDSINVRELKTIKPALQLHAKKYTGKRLLLIIYTDNTTALKYALKSGGTASVLLQELALDIQDIIIKHDLELSYKHIAAGVLNTAADSLSRIKKPLYEWKLPRRHFKKLESQWGRMMIDAFASREKTRTRRFWSHLPDPEAEATDAFN